MIVAHTPNNCHITVMLTSIKRGYGYNGKHIAMLRVAKSTVNNKLPDCQPEGSPGPVGGALPHPQQTKWYSSTGTSSVKYLFGYVMCGGNKGM